MSKQSTRATRSASSPLGGECCQRVRFRVTSAARFGPFAVGAPLLAHLSFRCTLKSTRIHDGESFSDPSTSRNSSAAFWLSFPLHVEDVEFLDPNFAFSCSHVPPAPRPPRALTFPHFQLSHFVPFCLVPFRALPFLTRCVCAFFIRFSCRWHVDFVFQVN